MCSLKEGGETEREREREKGEEEGHAGGVLFGGLKAPWREPHKKHLRHPLTMEKNA